MPPATPAAPRSSVTVVVPLTGDAAALVRALPVLVERWPADVPADLLVPVGELDARAERLLADLDADQVVRTEATGFGALCEAVARRTTGRLVVVDQDDLPSAQALAALLGSDAPVAAEERCVALDAPLLATHPVLSAALSLPALAALATAVTRPAAPVPARPLLSAALIVRDEQRALPACLASLAGVVDEVVVCDTGSTDRTEEVAAAMGARLVRTAWQDDFSAARNVALAACRGDWVLSIDADEQLLLPGGRGALQAAVTQDAVDSFGLRIVSATDRHSDGGYEHHALRLFRRDGLHWVGAVHETLRHVGSGDMPSSAGLPGVELAHDGYLGAVYAEKDKGQRNLRLAEKDYDAAAAGTGRELWKAAYELARALSAAGGDADRQEPLLREALAALPATGVEHARLGILLRLAALLVLSGRCDEGAELAEQATALMPASLTAWMCLARARVGQGRPAQALALLDEYDRLQRGRSTDDDAHFADVEEVAVELPRLRAVLLLELDRPAEAADVLTGLAGRHPDRVDWLLLATALQASSPDWADRLAALAATAPGTALPQLSALPADAAERLTAALAAHGVQAADWTEEAVLARAAEEALRGADPEALAAAARELEAEEPATALAVWRSGPASARSQVGAARCLIALDRVGEAVDALDDLDVDGLEPADLLTVALLAEHVGDHDSARSLLRLLPPLEGDLARTVEGMAVRLAG